MKPGFGRLLISAQNISVIFGRSWLRFRHDPFVALKEISLNIYAGESLGVIGRNGVGKTTLLRVLASIIEPDRGRLQNYDAKTAMLSLQAGFDNQATGRTNIFLSSLLLGFTESEIREKIQEIIEFAELGGFIDKPLSTYSAGMRARLGFSICLYMQPDVLLIDEALGVGDIEFRKKSAKAMREKIHSDQTVVLVSHNAGTIKNLCNRAVWIENGVIQMEGETALVVDAYKDFVKSHPRAGLS